MPKPHQKSIGIEIEPVEPKVTPAEHVDTSFFTQSKLASAPKKRKHIPKGLWSKCPDCGIMIYNQDLVDNFRVCPECHYHFHFGARDRILSLANEGSFHEIDEDIVSVDPLNFEGPAKYTEKLNANKKKTGLKDAVVTGMATIGAHQVAIGVMDFKFLGGSMGSVVGEKLTRVIEAGTQKNLPVIIVSCSGGARMYEGMLSLMQMAKTCGALAYHAKKNLPYISVLTHPTTAGVMASYASVGDLIIAEPKAMIGFAGPRVIKDTTQAKLPPGFQTAEFLQDRGLIDAIVPRPEMRQRLTLYLDYLSQGRPSR